MPRSTADNLSAVSEELICSADFEGFYTDVNAAFTRELGWSEPELVNNPYLEFVHLDDRKATELAITRLRAGNEGSFADHRNRMLTKSGEVFWYDWRFYLHEDQIYALGRRAAEEQEALEDVVTRVFKERAQAEAARLEEQRKESQSAIGNVEADLDDAKMQLNRAKTLSLYVGAIATALGIAGTGLVWAVKRVEDNAVRSRQAEERKEDVDEALGELDERMEASEQKIQILGKLADETQIQVSRSTEYIVEKIDAAHPRAKGKVDPNPVVRKAKDKVDLIEQSRRIEELFQRDPQNAGDPFAEVDVSSKKEDDEEERED